jgi:hypothetical protein
MPCITDLKSTNNSGRKYYPEYQYDDEGEGAI